MLAERLPTSDLLPCSRLSPRLVCALAFVILCLARAALAARNEADAAAQAFFDSPALVQFEVELDPERFEQLAQSPRRYVPGTVKVGNQSFEQVGVRLKGTGTFQPISKRPNLVLKFDWKRADQEFAGLTKLFLNNSLQDPSLLSEFVASQAYTAADISTPRITHARVRLNGRDLGLCVLAEAVNKRFLRRHFSDAQGNLYEGTFRDVNAPLEQDNGKKGERSDLIALATAAALPDREARRQALSQALDVGKFLDFLAVEMIIANWDGYALHQNNYRVYHDSGSNLLYWIPHGLDNSIFETGFSVVPPRRALLTSALLETPDDRAAFQQRVRSLLPRVFDPAKILHRIDGEVAKMRQGASPQESERIEQHASLFRRRVQERAVRVKEQLDGTGRNTPSFAPNNVAVLTGWTAKPDWNDSPLDAPDLEGQKTLRVTATNGYCFGSWRIPVWLPPGRYRLEGSTTTAGVKGLPSMTGSGAGVRALGNMRGSGVDGTQPWTPVQHNFTVEEGCEYGELIAELRAYRGKASFDPTRFRLIRLSPPH